MGFAVTAQVDASGALEVTIRENAVARMRDHGITPINRTTVAAELQRNWTLPSGQALGQVFHDHHHSYGLLMDSFDDHLRAEAAAVDPGRKERKKMSVELNHTIIPAKDKWASAKFLADILNLEAGPEWGHFVPVKTGNGVTLDFSDSEGFRPQHYAFLVSEAEFDAALARIRASGVKHYANFRRERPGEINHLYGGRGVYFDDPNGHLLELITRPYGPTPEGG
jgi:catechol 2,3-dioxygenase-like lactoylglutathione lyase family enzyme